MITTEPTKAIEPIHDRMPAVLVESQIDPFLDGLLNEFGPSAAALKWTESENFLKKGKAAGESPPPPQGELF